MKKTILLAMLIILLSSCGGDSITYDNCLRDVEWATRNDCKQCHSTRYIPE